MTNPNTPQEGATLTLPIGQKAITQDISRDFSLPDYQPEIKRLLRINAYPSPPRTTATRDQMQLDGTIDYLVLYTGNDNKLYCAPLSADYALSLPLTDTTSPLHSNWESWVGDEPVCTCHITPTSTTGRVTAPRRLSIKCHITADVKAYATCPTGISPHAITTPTEVLTHTTPSLKLLRTTTPLITLQDDMILTPTEEAHTRVVCAEGVVMVHETTPASNAVACSGEVMLKLLLAKETTDESEQILVSQRKIPFVQTLELAGLAPSDSAVTHGTCAQMSVTFEEGKLHTEVGMVLEVVGQSNLPTAYVKDLYATTHHTQATYATHPTEMALLCQSGNFTLSDSVSLSDVGIPATAQVVDVSITATPQALQQNKGKYLLTGTCDVHLLLQQGQEYTTQTLTLPFRYGFEPRTTLPDLPDDGVVMSGRVQALTCRGRMDGERLGIDAEMSVALRLTLPSTITTLADVSIGEQVTRPRGEYVICFPTAGETLWDVAKKYHAPLTTLSLANGLTCATSPDTQNSLDEVKYLIV